MAIINITDKSQVPDGDQFKGSDPTESFDVSLGEDGDKSKAVNKLRMPSNDGSYFGGQLAPNDNGEYNPALPANKLKTATIISKTGVNIAANTYSGEYDLLPINIGSLKQTLYPSNRFLRQNLVDGIIGSSNITIPITYFAYSWGKNSLGQLGNGSTTQVNSPTKLPLGNNFIECSAAQDNGWLIRSDNTLWGTGQDAQGELGRGVGAGFVTSFIQIGVDTDWDLIAGGVWATTAHKINGKSYGWGTGGQGQAGNNTGGKITTPIEQPNVAPYSTLINFIKMKQGTNVGYALASDGNVWGWGFQGDGIGRIGSNDLPTTHLTPVPAAGGHSFISFGSGQAHCLAIDTSNKLWGWGFGIYGQIGDGSATNSPLPIAVGSLNWLKVSGGSLHSAGIDLSGNLYTWGDNGSGQLGNGTVGGTVATPTQISATGDWVDINCGWGWTIAKRSNGDVYSWGDNTYGQLGLNDIVQRTTPVLIPGFTYDKISVGHYNTIVLSSV